MDPLTIGLIAAGGLARGIGAGMGTLAGGKALFGEDQQARLRELQRLEEANALGLTDEERSQLSQILLDPVQAQAKERMQRQQALLGSTGAATSGQALGDLMRQQEQQDAITQAATAKLAQADIARKAQLEEEMRSLESARSAREASKQAALGSFITGVGSAADAAVRYQSLQDMTARRNIQADEAIDKDLINLLESF